MDNTYNAETWTLASQKYGNNQYWHYEYSEFDDLVRAYTTGSEHGTELRYFYNSEGALARIEQYATTTTESTWVSTERYYYDSADRATRIIRQDAEGDSYECRWEYDHNNNVTNLVETVNGQTHTTAYTYDPEQRISLLTTDGITSGYAYDGLGRLSNQEINSGTAQSLNRKYGYLTVEGTEVQEDGTSVKVTYATAQVGTLELDAAHYDRTYTYTYDANGNILSVSDGTNTTSYIYDELNQLIQENNEAADKTWVFLYDNGGNILLKKEYDYTTEEITIPNNVEHDYEYSDDHWGDLLTAYKGQTINYDGIGNRVSDGTWTYDWENGRQLASMTRTGEAWSYSYNADGLRTERSDGTTTYDYIYSGSTLIQMTVGEDVLYFTYDAAGTPMAVTFNGTKYFYATNLQGDIIAILDTAGNAVVEYTYDAWGNILTATDSTLGNLNPLRYRGYVYDSETGFYYLQSRYYDPELGRFINADAYASTGQGILGNNMFAYCLNNPVNRTDVLGQVSLWYYLIVDHDMGFIHRMVQTHILATSGPEIVVELVLPGLGRADIVNTKTGRVWEVKHAGKKPEFREWIAAAQAVGYIGGEQNGVLIEGLGDAGEFEGEFLISCMDSTYLITYYTPSDGVVLYSVKDITGTENAYENAIVYNYVPKKQTSYVPNIQFFFYQSQEVLADYIKMVYMAEHGENAQQNI